MTRGDRVRIISRAHDRGCRHCIERNGNICCIGSEGKIVDDTYSMDRPYQVTFKIHEVDMRCFFRKRDLERIKQPRKQKGLLIDLDEVEIDEEI
jgi:hypothetical protein